MLHFKKILLLLAAALTLTGCSAVNFSVEGLISAPKFTKEQSKIHEALIQAVGSNITLKYPKSGDNRSAYVIANIDNEPGEEALVFYEYVGAGKKEGLWVNVLDKNDDGDWVSVGELAGTGTEVSKVIIAPMGNNNDIQVLVGYQNMTSDEKSLQIYNYYNQVFKVVGTDTYSLLEAFDITGNGSNELIIIQRSSDYEGKNNQYIASLLEMNDTGFCKSGTVKMCSNVTSYVNMTTEISKDGKRAIYIDELTNKNQLQTEILYYENSQLVNPIEQNRKKLLPLCTRPVGYYSSDIDNDGVVEIPVETPLLGYENAVADEQLMMTNWLEYDGSEQFKVKLSGYYSLSDGYAMTYPKRWEDQITVKKDKDSKETVFYKYDGDINGTMTELMRVAAVSEDNRAEYIDKGYQTVETHGKLYYMVKLPKETKEPLVLTIDELKNSFYIVD